MNTPPERRRAQQTALVGAELLLPGRSATDLALIVEGSRIEAIVPYGELSESIRRIAVDGLIISPGFIDLQVNGGGGLLFNDTPSTETIRDIGEAHRAFGTTSFLPTLISDRPDTMLDAAKAVAKGLAEPVPGLIGLHLEGPYLNPSRHGIHDPACFTPVDEGLLLRIRSAVSGSLMVTLAPECIDGAALRRLAGAGILLAAGHTAATFEETRVALANGLRGFTHLFNAMPPMLSREPGPVAAALESEAWCTLIADGHHVHEAMLRLVVRAKSDGRLILVTDAMPPAGTDLDRFTLGQRPIEVRDGRCIDAEGTLAGSNLTMIDAVRFAVRRLGLPLHRAVAMASSEPAAFLGRTDELGSLMPGRRADLVMLTPELDIAAVIMAGDLTAISS